MVNVVCVQIVGSKKIIVFKTIVNKNNSLGFFLLNYVFFYLLFFYFFFTASYNITKIYNAIIIIEVRFRCME